MASSKRPGLKFSQKVSIKRPCLSQILRASVHENLGNLKRLLNNLVYLNFNPESLKRHGFIIETIEYILQRERDKAAPRLVTIGKMSLETPFGPPGLCCTCYL